MKIKELMEQQRKDIKRGVTYKSGCAIDSNDAPDYIRTAEMKKKELLRVTCPFMVVLHRDTKPPVPKIADTMVQKIWVS